MHAHSADMFLPRAIWRVSAFCALPGFVPPAEPCVRDAPQPEAVPLTGRAHCKLFPVGQMCLYSHVLTHEHTCEDK